MMPTLQPASSSVGMTLPACAPPQADAAISNYLAGRQFSVTDEDGTPHGTVRINDEGMSYGFGSFLRQRGADEGDILVAEFDLSGGGALLRLGDDELLEEMSPAT
jgi:hypothetical protein